MSLSKPLKHTPTIPNELTKFKPTHSLSFGLTKHQIDLLTAFQIRKKKWKLLLPFDLISIIFEYAKLIMIFNEYNQYYIQTNTTPFYDDYTITKFYLVTENHYLQISCGKYLTNASKVNITLLTEIPDYMNLKFGIKKGYSKTSNNQLLAFHISGMEKHIDIFHPNTGILTHLCPTFNLLKQSDTISMQITNDYFLVTYNKTAELYKNLNNMFPKNYIDELLFFVGIFFEFPVAPMNKAKIKSVTLRFE